MYGRFCGNDTLPAPIVTPSPYVEVTFVTDQIVVDRGFQLQYKMAGKINDSSKIYDMNDIGIGTKVIFTAVLMV